MEPCNDLEALTKQLAAKREAAAGVHREIIGDVTHRVAIERLSREMGPLTPPQEESRRREASEREENRAQHAVIDRWKALISKVGIRYEACRLQTFELSSAADVAAQQQAVIDQAAVYCQAMPDMIADGCGLVFFGPKGTGKDHLLTACMRAAVLAHRKSVAWINGMDFCGDVRDLIDDGQSEKAFIRAHTHADVLAISDPLPPGVEPLTNHQAQMLFRVVDARYRKRKPTWITVNASGRAELDRRMSAQTADRITDGAIALFCNWPSYRKTNQCT